MNQLKHILVFIAIIALSVFVAIKSNNSNDILKYTTIAILALFAFNIIARKSLRFKGYFTSPLNIYTAKSKTTKYFDVVPELLFEKMIEVLESSTFSLADYNKEKLEILATTGFTFQSWGENLYFEFTPKGEGTELKFCSAALFQMYTWGKNERNTDEVLSKIEASFTI